MTPRFKISLRTIGLAGTLVLSGLASTARGQDLAYGPSWSSGYEGGYAAPLIQGDYVGAPLTRVPRPSELVPSAWGYGTYGIPTVAGIRSASVGRPTVYVIDAPPPAVRAAAPGRSRILTRDRRGRWSGASATAQARGVPLPAVPPSAEMTGGARVVPVRVSRR